MTVQLGLMDRAAPYAGSPRRARLVLLVAALAAALLAPSAVAIAPAQAAVQSPVVHPDSTVTFTLEAPTASTVTVGYRGKVQLDAPMTRDEDGVWSVTVGPLEPDYYDYEFYVDGVGTSDPANTDLLHPGSTRHLFLVPGAAADFLTEQNVPHGEVTHLDYYSEVTATERRATVWTPPDYEPTGKPYPTFYLVHGGGGNSYHWDTIGRASVILDNLYAAGQLEPMVVVMPDANIPGGSGLPQDDQFPIELIDNLVPAVEDAYNVSKSKNKRALAGLSRGGGQVWNTLFTYPKEFQYIGVMSSGLARSRAAIEAQLTKQAVNTINRTELHAIYIGDTTDIAYEGNVAVRAMFDRVGIEYEFGGVYPDSGHTWHVWRHNLADFAPRLFN
jgi:enterochelin esterase-like enzyme